MSVCAWDGHCSDKKKYVMLLLKAAANDELL